MRVGLDGLDRLRKSTFIVAGQFYFVKVKILKKDYVSTVCYKAIYSKGSLLLSVTCILILCVFGKVYGTFGEKNIVYTCLN